MMTTGVLPTTGSQPIALFMSVNGATPTSANINANGNYAGANITRFQLVPPSGERWLINIIRISLECTKSINEDGYGQNSTPLTTGINLQITDNSNTELYNLNSSIPILKFVEWYRISELPNIWTANTLALTTTQITPAQPILLVGGQQRLTMLLNDDFTGRNIVSHTFFTRGIKLRNFELKGQSVYNGY